MITTEFHAGSGGPSTVIRDLVRALIQKGVDVTLEIPGGGDFAEGLPRVDSDNGRAMAKYLSASRARGGREILHSHGVWEPRILWTVQRTRPPGSPWVLSPHGAIAVLMNRPRYRGRLLLARMVMAPLLRRADVLLCNTEFEADATRRVVSHPNVRVLPWGVRLGDTIATQPSSSFPPVVGFLGRLHPIKRVEMLLDAVSLLRKQGIPLRVAIGGAGESEYVSFLRKHADAIGIGDCVRWEGWIPEEGRCGFLKGLSALALVSECENFGCVVSEAMLAGVPVVVTVSCPWPVLRQEDLGAWVACTPEAVAEALRHLLENPVQTRVRAARARAWAERELSWDGVSARYLEILDAIG